MRIRRRKIDGGMVFMALACVCGVALGVLWQPSMAAADNANESDGFGCCAATGTCVGFPGFNCLTSTPFCSTCSSGCAGSTTLPGFKCVAGAGNWTACVGSFTACSTIFTENIQACTIICACDPSSNIPVGCAGAWQTGCVLSMDSSDTDGQ